MPLSHYALDTFVSQGLSQLTSCSPASLASEFPDRQEWLSEFILRRIFNNHVAEERVAAAFTLIRRAEAALDEWELGCTATLDNVQRPSVYFRALRHFEASIAALWQGLDFGRRAVGIDLFAKGDASVYERVNWLYNKGRHFDYASLPAGAQHPLWLTNEGVSSHEHAVTFDEMQDALRLLGRVASRIAKGQFDPTADAGK